MSMSLRTAILLIPLLGCGALPIKGQPVEMVGQTVQVRLEDDRVAEGVVQLWGPNSLQLRTADGASPEFDWPEVSEVLRYRTRGHTSQGFLIGALLGGAVAGTHAGVTWEPCTFVCFGPQDRSGTIALAALIGVVAGGAVGTLVGVAIRSPVWEPVAIPVISPNAAAISIGVRWRLPR
jgi:hypothetical protein